MLTCISCTRDRYIQITGYAQGGVYSVKLNMEGVWSKPEELQSGIDSILNIIDTTLSGYNKNSQLSKFNRGDTIVPNIIFRDLYNKSRQLWKRTDGAVDAAAAELYDIWGFGFSSDSLPSPQKVDSVLARSGMKYMPEGLGQAVGKGFSLNFNCMAQGYTVDLVAKYLRNRGVHDMLVDIGEIYCNGVNPEGKPWSIGVDNPKDGNDTPGADMNGVWKSDGAPHGIVTSGNYRKYYVHDGRKYSHTIDPRTGYPVEHNLLSATILAPDAMTADAYATYCMVIGLEEARSFISRSDGIDGYLIYEEGGEFKTWASTGFQLRSGDDK